VEPGIGMMVGMPGRRDRLRVQAMASCAGVQPFCWASALTLLKSSRLLGKFFG
jgi:hypothetical protein